ncbi:MAG: hypothetical protein GX224_04900 [Thermoplasmatales archaeon]|nr:hypothetical protein [Thermoplasmatales archaeon]
MSKTGVLGKRLRELGSVAVCFSGGRDSSVLAAVAAECLPDSHVAVFVDVPVLSRGHAAGAEAVAEKIGCRFAYVRLGWEDVPGMRYNGPRRCYHCKRAIYETAWEVARDFGFEHVVAGENADDEPATRPGRAAGEELGIGYPLADVGFGDSDVRDLMGELGLDGLVENTCMATRYPAGMQLDNGCVEFAGECERAILGVVDAPTLRVRIHGRGAVIEAYPRDLEKIRGRIDEVERALARRGFAAVSLSVRK